MIRAGDTFTWRGVELGYLAHPYNRAAENERAIEVPIAEHFIATHDGYGLEVGNVLGHYADHEHRVVDLYEVAAGVENLDLFDARGSYDWIVAISTLEHVRWEAKGAGNTRWEEEPDPAGPIDGLAHLRSLLRPGGELLITAPFGQHPYFDGAILAGLGADDEATFTFEGDHWTEHPGERLWRAARKLRWAGAVWVATWRA